MAPIKVHVTLLPDVAADAEARALALKEIRGVCNIADVNPKRFERYGLISGIVDESDIDKIRGVKFVKSVEADRTRHTL